MTFTVETGTGSATANSLADVAGFDAWLLDRGITLSGSPDTTAKEQLLVKATDFFEQRFAQQLNGRVEFPETPQRLSLPRLELYDNQLGRVVTGIPEAIKEVIYEYAQRAHVAALQPDPVVDATGQRVTRKKLGDLEIEYSEEGSVWLVRSYPAADLRMRRFLIGAGQGGTIRA